ncbi:hypothetical protein KIL84_019633 [Mauremys mutica]|uniref:Uncharacterized protein n=1 Tax=Mauremys mutica TaxID=74926 RepID=A0A9D4BBF1_9SAUR|nr:hypothetical protein KIL84_019633 [Mauremys mutica]
MCSESLIFTFLKGSVGNSNPTFLKKVQISALTEVNKQTRKTQPFRLVKLGSPDSHSYKLIIKLQSCHKNKTTLVKTHLGQCLVDWTLKNKSFQMFLHAVNLYYSSNLIFTSST